MLYTSHGTFKVKFVCATKGEGGGHGGWGWGQTSCQFFDPTK